MNPTASPETPQNATHDRPDKAGRKGRSWPLWILAALAVSAAVWAHYRYILPARSIRERPAVVYSPSRTASQPTSAASPISLVANPLAGANLQRLDKPPAQVVLPPDSQYLYGFRMVKDGVVMDNLNFTSSAQVAAVEAHYRTSLTAQGYKEVRANASAGGGGPGRLFLRGSKEYYRIVLRRDDNAQVTTISLVVSHLE